MNPFKKYPATSFLVSTVAACILSIYTLERFNVKNYLRGRLEPRRYGTVENPDYLIRAAFEADPNYVSWIVTPEFKNRRRMEDLRERVEERAEQFSAIDANLVSIEREFDESGAQAAYARMQSLGLGKTVTAIRLGYFDLDMLEETRLLTMIKDYVLQNYLLERKFDINERELTKEVFHNLTGKPFPKNIDIVREDIFGKTIEAYYSSMLGRITYEDLLPIKNFLNILHEFGHMATQHREYWTTQSFSEIGTLEEACAYAMVNAGLNDIKSNEKLKEFAFGADHIFCIHMGDECRAYYDGEYDRHSSGAALAVATSAVLMDPYKTYNYLATLQNSSLESLDPRIKEQMKRNAVAFEGDMISDLYKMNAELRKDRNRAKDLDNRYRALLTRFSEAGVVLSAEDSKYLSSKL